MILLTGWVDVNPEKRDAALVAGKPHMQATRAWPGCLDYVWSADPLNPARIYIYERWEDADSLTSHLAGPHYAAMRDTIAAGMGKAMGLSTDEMLRHPHGLFGTPDAICEELERRREQYGISYVTVGDNALEAFAPVVARLTGK